MSAVALYKGAASRIVTGGVPVTAIYGPVLGGIITNPQTPANQGIAEVEILYIDLTGPAALGETATTVPLQPGQSFTIPANDVLSVSVNAATTGHRFSVVVKQPAVPYPPTPAAGDFPPTSPTSLTRSIPSYLYQQYADDSDLAAFVAAFNNLAQQQVDWFNAVNLPIYTQLTAALLDWVAEGLYGMTRPVLASGRNRNQGLLNTYRLNVMKLNARRIIGPQNVSATSDDTFQRILTWAFFKGDGKHFNVRWLKRRVMRFLLGTNGISYNVDQTYQVSVVLGLDRQVNITLVTGIRTVTGGAFYNGFRLNTKKLNQLDTTFQGTTSLPNTTIFKEAVDSGALELPFQYSYVVVA